MEGARHIPETPALERLDVLLAAGLRNQVQRAQTAALFGGYVGKFAQGDEEWAVRPGDGHIGDHQGPFPGAQLREKHLDVGHHTHTPAFGIEHLFQCTLALRVVVQNKYADLPGLDGRRRSAHFSSIAFGRDGMEGGGRVSANRSLTSLVVVSAAGNGALLYRFLRRLASKQS